MQRTPQAAFEVIALSAFVLVGSSACKEAPKPTWGADVAPLVAERCSGCHQAGGAAFPLDTYEAVRSMGQPLAHDVTTRRMPPWPPAHDETCPSLIGDRRLPQSDVDMLDAWVKSGMPRGESPGELPKPPAFGVLDDIAVEVGPSAAYQPPREADDYHCFVVDPGLDADAFITAYRVAAGPAVHHLQLWEIDDDAGAQQIEALDAASPEPGLACSLWPGVPVRFLTVWGPSDPVRRHPAGTGVRVRAHKKLVLQVHYHRAAAPDQTHVGLELRDRVDHEATLIGIGPSTFVLPPRLPAITVHAETTLPEAATLWGVRGHMHSLGSEIHMTRRRPSTSGCLLSIPKWDPEWQLMYFYERPIELAAGDVLSVDCTYNTMSKSTPTFDGFTADDEMCNGYFYVTGLAP